MSDKNIIDLFNKTKISAKKYKSTGYIELEGINGKCRKFNKDLFEKYDVSARKIVFEKLGNIIIKDNPNKYGEDLCVITKDIPYKYIEIQVYASWKEEKFPHKKPYIHARKTRFSNKTLFICFSNDFTQVILFSKYYVHDTPSRLKKYDRELVHFIEWKNVYLIPTEKLSIKEIKKMSGISTSDTEDSVSSS